MNYKYEDFDFITDELSRRNIMGGIWALNKLELWDWLKNFIPEPNKGFAYSDTIEITNIGNMLQSNENPYQSYHTGFSFEWTMRTLQIIVHTNLEEFKNSWLTKIIQEE
jgi:hypothetical protein